MPKGTIEHVNLTVTNPERSAELFKQLCDWHERWSGPSMMGGFASPPQMDLVIPTDYYRDGRYRHPTASELTSDEMHATDQG